MVKSKQRLKEPEGLGVLRSRLKELIARKEHQLNRSINNNDVAEATGLDAHTIARWMKPTPIKRVESDAVRKLCRYLDCELGDLLYIDYSSTSN